jgi:methionyl-tRNA synthetase
VQYLQFLGKDNVPFHAISYPATLLGSGEPWKTVDVIKGFHWLTYEGGKFSTSQRRGIFTDAALDVLPADLWRWWLIANAPESADVDFNFRRFATDIGKDLADVFGNLATRTTSFASQAFDGRIPADGVPGPAEQALAVEVDRRTLVLRGWHERLEFRRAAAETRALWVLANGYLQKQAPWTTVKSDPARAAVTTRTALNLVWHCASLAWCIIPSLANCVLSAFGDPTDCPPWSNRPASTFLDVRKGDPISRIDPLVNKLTGTEISHLETRFSGAAA